MTKLESTILYLLSRSKKLGKKNLCKIELFKYIYLLEVESYKFTGKGFFDSNVIFSRDKNGPISINIYEALNNLEVRQINIKEERKSDYNHPRHSITLKNNIKKFNLTESEKLFINSVLGSYVNLSIKKLKSLVYETLPMSEMLKEEKEQKVKLLKGSPMNFATIPLDEDIVDLITS